MTADSSWPERSSADFSSRERSSVDEAAVWARMTAVYAAFQAGDPDAVDAVMDRQVTIWDSAEPAMVRGLAALQDLRTRRPTDAAAPTVTAVEATDPVIDIWGDTALLRHRLRVRFAGDVADEVIRNTSVWRRVDGQWFAVHNHEDVLPAG